MEEREGMHLLVKRLIHELNRGTVKLQVKEKGDGVDSWVKKMRYEWIHGLERRKS